MNFGIITFFIFSVILYLSSAQQEEDRERIFRNRGKREHGHGVTGPVHTFVKTDKHANFKWGVRHHVGHEYAGRRK